MANRKAYDLLIQAESGLASVTGTAEGPARTGTSVVDIATGATAHAAILEALIRRGITGRGGRITVSMFDVMAEWLSVPLLNHEAGQSPSRQGLSHPSIAPYGAFAAKGCELVLLAVQTDREWASLAQHLLGQPDLSTDPRFATNMARVTNRQATDATVAAACALLPLGQLLATLARADLAFASVNDMAGLSAHPHLRRVTVETPNGPVSLPAPPAVFEETPRTLGPVPALGGPSA